MTLLAACGAAEDRAGSQTPAPATGAASAGPVAKSGPSTRATPDPSAPAVHPVATAKEPEHHVHAGDMAVALTFDDGPSPTYTPQVLSILHQYNVTATFFMIGTNIERHPEVLRQVLAAGHLVGNHTWSHPDLRALDPAKVREEIERTGDIITRVGRGAPPILFRAPYGNFTGTAMAVSASLGMHPVAWSVDPRDWSRPGAQAIVDGVLGAVRTEAIVLNHDGALLDPGQTEVGGPADRSETVAALRTYLPRLIDAGYEFTVPDPAR
ncbi:polysaccharide deacetylase family protein [Kitasatospora cystarginea]|uniref:Polysaccharide deacetylase family protein n=2 Tax=Streptomycetaceae TaxID=2062 RepID=A0ABP5R3E3_9ACTN